MKVFPVVRKVSAPFSTASKFLITFWRLSTSVLSESASGPSLGVNSPRSFFRPVTVTFKLSSNLFALSNNGPAAAVFCSRPYEGWPSIAALFASVWPPGVPAESATNFGESIVSELSVAITSMGNGGIRSSRLTVTVTASFLFALASRYFGVNLNAGHILIIDLQGACRFFKVVSRKRESERGEQNDAARDHE